jgi:hypothetical protein
MLGRQVCSLDVLRRPALFELFHVGFEQNLLFGVPDEVGVAYVDPIDIVSELLEGLTITEIQTSIPLEVTDRVGRTVMLSGFPEVTVAEVDLGQGVDDAAANIVFGLTSGTRIRHNMTSSKCVRVNVIRTYKNYILLNVEKRQ